MPSPPESGLGVDVLCLLPFASGDHKGAPLRLFYCLLPLASCLLPLAYSLFPVPYSLRTNNATS
ncbi:hypothetical protein E1H12_16320 [Geitlerinema sp. P-1104]|nr:hypothetical protein [Geitlerinema sp. P-1104]